VLSLVTINYNDEAGLKRTINSVCKQQIDFEFEHIIIDGASTDRSTDVIAKYANSTVNVIAVSEKDGGIYEAMNKGLRMASGSHVAFLNSGDVLNHSEVLKNITNAILYDKCADFIYSDLCFTDDHGNVSREWCAGTFWKPKLYYGWMPPHPMTTIRRSVLNEAGAFDQRLQIAADYNLMLKILMRPDISVRYLAETSVCMERGGISNGSVGGILKANYEVLKSWFEIKGIIAPYWIVFTKPFSKTLQLKWSGSK
jgi:glycosyltransferase involved in cell wall biosynthesis